MKIIKFALPILALSSLLGGCAVYGPPPVYAQEAYYQPAPVYVAPQPVYVQPAVGFQFGYWGGGRRWGHRHHHH